MQLASTPRPAFLAQTLLVLALLAAGTHAIIPKGYMLDRSAETGAIAVVFCSAGMGTEMRMMNLQTGEFASASDLPASGGSNLCALASAGLDDAAFPVDALPRAPERVAEQRHTSELHQALRRSPQLIRPPSRAPPALL
ncbi:hypothetical protein [Maricaulis sp.]|uniref:hypothetical protein n=1 Tax=Maricaulis sp. TaxID=1486257 RepID=UPI002637FF51|nr:hypothetical protein [Maricaulis sp.]